MALRASRVEDAAFVTDTLQDVVEQVRTLMPEQAPPTIAPSSRNPEQAREALLHIESLLRGHRLIPDALLRNLGKHLGGATQVQTAYTQLLEQVDRFDFTGALDSVSTLVQELKS